MLKALILGSISAAVFVLLWGSTGWEHKNTKMPCKKHLSISFFPSRKVAAVGPEGLTCQIMSTLSEIGLKKVSPNAKVPTEEDCKTACAAVPDHKCAFYTYKQSTRTCFFFSAKNQLATSSTPSATLARRFMSTFFYKYSLTTF